METVGSYKAKTHFSELLERVRKGEKIQITKHGVPIANLSPITRSTKDEISAAIEELQKFREDKELGGLKVKSLISEGRK